MSAPGFIPDSEFVPDAPAQQAQAAPSQATPGFIPDAEFQPDDDKYGTTGQTALGVGERVAKGVIGPGVELAERAGTALGIPGLTPEDQAGRAAALPTGVGPLSEAAGFAGSMFTGVGEGKLIGELGEGAAHLAGLGGEGASTVSKIAASGIRGSAEMAALQAGDETGKLINQDPNTSLGQAAINIGLSGLMGGAGGAVLGSISPLWESAKNKMGVEKLTSDYMGESKFIHENPDPVQAAQQEINDRIGSADQLMNGGLKKELIEKLTSDLKPEQVQAHIDHIESLIEGAPAALKKDQLFQDAVDQWRKVVPQFQEQAEENFPTGEVHEQMALPSRELRPDSITQETPPGALRSLQDLRSTPAAIGPEVPGFGASEVTPIGSSQPALGLPPTRSQLPDPSAVFKATENLKRQFQEWSQYNKALVPISERPFRDASKGMASSLKESLEDSKVWGDAGNVQKAYNKAISPLYDIQKEFLGKFASKEMGERVADPTKINTYLNQAEKTKAGLKSNYVRNYLDQTQKAADSINEAYINHGLEQPLEEKLNPTPVLEHSLNTPPSPGVTLARWTQRGGAATMAGRGAGEMGASAVGGGLGALVGHPLVGAWMGEKVLTPVFSALAKPLAESAIHAGAAKASVDYVGNVIKGGKTLSDAASSFFKSGAEIFPKSLIPDMASREKLEKSLEYAQNPQNLLNVGGNIGHYLPAHQTAAAAMSQTAVNYLQSLKPKQLQNSPLDKPTPVDRFAQEKYNRQIDIAQQPLLALKYAKQGTLQPQDVMTINTIYPGLAKKMVSQVQEEMINHISESGTIPYKMRVSLSLLSGSPLDSTMTQPNMQAIMNANAPMSPPQSQAKPKKVSQSTAKTMEKTNSLYQTPDQARASGRTAGG